MVQYQSLILIDIKNKKCEPMTNEKANKLQFRNIWFEKNNQLIL